MNTSRKVNMVGRIQTTVYLLAPDTTHSFSSALLVSCNQLCFKLCNLAIQTLFPSLHCPSPIPNLLLVLHHLYTNNPANRPSCKATLPPHAFIGLRQKVHVTMCVQCKTPIWLEPQTESLIHIPQQRSWAIFMASTIGACISIFSYRVPTAEEAENAEDRVSQKKVDVVPFCHCSRLVYCKSLSYKV